MTVSNGPVEAPPSSLAPDPLGLARYYLARYYLARSNIGRRRGLLILTGLAVAAGMALNWGWLTAIGVAPVLVSLLPCAAMCALGLCMNRAGGKPCSTGTSVRNTVSAGSMAVPIADAEPQSPKERNTIDA